MNSSEINVQVKTPFKRLLVRGTFGGAGVCTAQIVTSSLLLPFKLMALDQQNYTALFGYITGIALPINKTTGIPFACVLIFCK